jgi:hypothetical protein
MSTSVEGVVIGLNVIVQSTPMVLLYSSPAISNPARRSALIGDATEPIPGATG